MVTTSCTASAPFRRGGFLLNHRVTSYDRLRPGGLVIAAIQVVIDLRAGQSEQETVLTRMLSRVFPMMLSCACLVVAGASLLAGGGGGLYWLVPAVLLALISGLLNAWVLLVEILR